MITKPGIYTDIDPTAYFAGFTPTPALSNTIISILIDGTPAEAKHAHTVLNPDPEVRKANIAMRMGDVTHQLALGKGRGYRVDRTGRKWDRRNTEVAEWLDACEADGVTPIKEKDIADAEAMAAVLKARIAETLADIGAQRGLQEPEGGWPYATEVVIAWVEETAHGPVWCQGMLDVWCQALNVILDPKITARLSERTVSYHVANQGWDRQGCWYERGMSKIFPEFAGRITFADMMVSPKPPYVFRAMGITPARAAALEPKIELALETFAICLKNGSWPGYSRGITYLEPTPNQMREALEAEMESDNGD